MMQVREFGLVEVGEVKLMRRYDILLEDKVLGWIDADDAILGSEDGEVQDVIFLDEHGSAISIVHDAELIE